MENNLVIPDSVDNAVKNLSDKPTLAIGQTISDLWQLVLGGRVAFAAEKQKIRYAHNLEEYRKSLDAKVNAIPEDKQIEPSLQIAAQALEDSKYCVESEELREMFANLIARAMHSDYSSKIHPSFSKIVQQLSPMDAQMLCILRRRQASGGMAVADYRRIASGYSYIILFECLPAEMPQNCTSEEAARSMIALQRLGLITIPSDAHFHEDHLYTVFSNNQLYKEFEERGKRLMFKVEINKRLARLTPLGEDFVRVCLY